MKYFQTQQSGFSLVETLVAITILLIIIVGPMSISSSTARSTSFASEQVVAFFLAQEGAEIVQKHRDDLLLQNFSNPQAGWDDFTDTVSGYLFRCYEVAGCSIELNTDSQATLKLPAPCVNNDCLLYKDPVGGRSYYTHDDASGVNEATPYTRKINLELNGSDEVKVVSTVTWQSGNIQDDQDVVVETYLYNVYGN